MWVGRVAAVIGLAAVAVRGKDRIVPETFGAALRRYRLAASLTQEALAERAAISPTSIAALERGRRKAPRLSTLRQLGEALGLDGTELAELAQAASGDGHGPLEMDEPTELEADCSFLTSLHIALLGAEPLAVPEEWLR